LPSRSGFQAANFVLRRALPVGPITKRPTSVSKASSGLPGLPCWPFLFFLRACGLCRAPYLMTTFREKSFSIGKYLVSPLTSMAAPGRFMAAVSVRSGQGPGTHDRIFRFIPEFATRQGARRYAARQGVIWAQSPSLAA
jgi:hypothetical protein